MKNVHCFVILCIVSILLIIVLGGCFNYNNGYSEESTSLEWFPDESHFVDYKIVGKKVVFRYSIAFQNNCECDVAFDIGAKFYKKDTRGWLKNNEILLGQSDCEKEENGYIPLRRNEKKSIVFSFEGDYLGGKVNTNLSFPEELVPIVIFKWESNSDI
ncbi:MAG: hypothetical protein ACI4DY_07675 [Monoglobaceae bacterium]